jgi:hypothetical protein
MMLDDRLDQSAAARSAMVPVGAGVEVGHQRDRLLAVERPFDRVAAALDQRAQLAAVPGLLVKTLC